MKDEIKEILNIIECWKNGDYVLAYSFNYDRASKQNDKILDYITNLQEKVKLLTTGLEATDKAYKDYKSRCEKAIQREMELSYLCDTQPDEELLNILQGEDKDVKDKR